MCIGLHVQYRLSLSDFNETGFFKTDFSKNPHIKFDENSLSESRVVPSGRAD
jgi:hypothetical protein